MAKKIPRDVKIRKVLDSPAALSCSCPITPESTDEELKALGAGCTNPQFCCPTLDAVRRVAGTYDKKEDDSA